MVLFLFLVEGQMEEQQHPSLNAAHDPPTPKQGFSPTQKQAERMTLAVGHLSACPTASTPGSILMGGSRSQGSVWMSIILWWETGHQTGGEQMPCSASQRTACLKARISRWRWTGNVRDYVRSPVASSGLRAAVNKPLFDVGVHPNLDRCNSSDT